MSRSYALADRYGQNRGPPQCARCCTLMKSASLFRVARSMTYPTTVRNAEERSCAPCHARGEVETNDVVVYRRNLACTPAGICSTSTWRPVRLDDGFSI